MSNSKGGLCICEDDLWGWLWIFICNVLGHTCTKYSKNTSPDPLNICLESTQDRKKIVNSQGVEGFAQVLLVAGYVAFITSGAEPWREAVFLLGRSVFVWMTISNINSISQESLTTYLIMTNYLGNPPKHFWKYLVLHIPNTLRHHAVCTVCHKKLKYVETKITEITPRLSI